MAHFAELNNQNIVVNVIVVNDESIQNLPFPESEPVGIAYLDSFLPGKIWKQTSYNNNFRFRYAGVKYEFHPECGEFGGFCPPQPFEDWLFDTEECLWKPPKPFPEDYNRILYKWDSTVHDWVKNTQMR
jgi:hypothetical protein